MIYLAIISLFLAVVIVSDWTVKRMKKEDYIDHRRPVKEWLIKAASGIPATILFLFANNFPMGDYWRLLTTPLLAAAYYFLLFDSTIGVMLHKGIFYTGTVWAGRAKTASIPFWAKILLCILFTTLYVML